MNMRNLPTVSVITPTCNREKFLPEAIESVLSQSFDNIEHIIIDDGSTDETRALVAAYESTGKVRYFYQENSGQNIARNLGLSKARGEFICFLDSDDYFLPSKIEKSLEVFTERPQVDLVYGDYIFVDEKGNQVNEQNMARYSGRISKQLLKDNCVSMNTTMARRSALLNIGGFSKHVKVADDYDLWLRMSANSDFYYLPECLSAYRTMANQISSNKLARFESNEEIITRFMNENNGILNQAEKVDILNFFYIRAARYFSNTNNFALSNHYFKKAFRAKVFTKRNWRALLRHGLNLIK